jgi:chitin synthase
VRTNVLLFWVISNGLLLVFILGGGVQSNIFEQQANMSRTKAYLTFILAFVALTNIIRFIGSTLYLGIRLFTG